MGIEKRIDKIESRLGEQEGFIQRTYDAVCECMPTKIRFRESYGAPSVDIYVSLLLHMILKKLDVQVNLTPQGYEFGPRPKDEE